MKLLVKKILSLFNYQINKLKNVEVINTQLHLPIKEKDSDWNLNTKAFIKSENKFDDFLTKVAKYSLIQLSKHILKQKKVYDFVECGCWKGHSSYILAELIKKNKKKINLHIFDSFEGLSKSSKKDSFYFNKTNLEQKKIKEHFSSSEFFVKKKVLGNYNFIKTYKGWIPKKFPEIKNKKFSLIFIDLCQYKPTLDSLKFFYPRLVKGGVIICRSYNSSAFPGETYAWNEYFKNKKISFFHKEVLNGCFLIK